MSFKRYDRPARPDVIEALQKIEDPWRRALACCIFNIVGESSDAKALLRSCLGADGLLDDLISLRLKMPALPRRPAWKVRQQKPWTPPHRLPSLLASEVEYANSAPVAWSDSNNVDAEIRDANFEPNWASALAAATLAVEPAELVVDQLGAISPFADLIVGISDAEKQALADQWEPPKPNDLPAPRGDLFRAFQVELPKVGEPALVSPETPSRKKSSNRQVALIRSLLDGEG